MPETLTFEVAAAGGVLIAILAFFVGRLTGAGKKRLAELQSTLDDALAQREAARGEAGDYKARVASHFEETSHRLHDLTLQYRAVYDHLAQGANELCPEGFEKLEGGLGLDALPEEALQPESSADAAPQGETADLSEDDAVMELSPEPGESERLADDGLADPSPDADEGDRALDLADEADSRDSQERASDPSR